MKIFHLNFFPLIDPAAFSYRSSFKKKNLFHVYFNLPRLLILVLIILKSVKYVIYIYMNMEAVSSSKPLGTFLLVYSIRTRR